MGTILEVTVVTEAPDTARELAQRCIDVARHWDDVLTTWRPQGELAQLNDRAGTGPVEVSRDLRWALEQMLAFARATDGAFDPAVGSIVFALREGEGRGHRPPPPRITEALTFGTGHVNLAGRAQLDAGGIGKGIALDAIAAELRARGASAWFLDFGGSSQLAHGHPPDAPAWKVLVAGNYTGSVHGTLRLREASLSTSRALPPNDPAGTIVDPRTGEPVPPPRLATVLAPDATTAEAWSKALVVFGREGVDLARAHGVEAIYQDATGVVVTPGFPLESRSTVQ